MLAFQPHFSGKVFSQQSAPQPQPHLHPQPNYNSLFTFGTDHPLFDFQDQETSTPTQPQMLSDHHHNWLENGQLTPKSTTRAHHRESSLSSLGSEGPASPYTANTSNPQVVGEYHDYHELPHHIPKPITPAHTPSKENFLTPHYPNFYNSSTMFGTGHHEGANRGHRQEYNASARPSAVANESPATPPEDRQKNVYKTSMPKLDRTMSDIYADELYSPNFHITSAPSTSTMAPTFSNSLQNDVFSARLQAANNQHLTASMNHSPLTIPPRERSPFRQGSPLAPTATFADPRSPNVRIGTATHLREQQKAENDARMLKQQMERGSPEQAAPATISPKDVDLVYHESEEDANMPLFPQSKHQGSMGVGQASSFSQVHLGSPGMTTQRNFSNLSGLTGAHQQAYSTQSPVEHQAGFGFTAPVVQNGHRNIPQQYPFVPRARKEQSNVSNMTEDFPSTLVSMESSSSEYVPESNEVTKPSNVSADTGTYTCTYHGCSLRFDTPAKLQRHKREGHRNSAAVTNGGLTSAAAQRNSQAGPHKCERINPSTGKPCNTIFSRPYDLTRHEDTIHNARKQKVHCPLCTEEKTFSRNDALTRHLRVVHPEHVDMSKARRRGGMRD